MKSTGNQMICFGLDLWDFVKEKLNVWLHEITKRGELRREKDSHAADTLTERLKQDQRLLWDQSRTFIKKALAERGVAGKKDLQALQKRVAALEEELQRRGIELPENRQ